MPDESTPIRKKVNNKNVFFNQIEQNGEYIPFGVNDEDIQMYDNEGNKIGSLHDFYEAWVDFISSTWFNFLNDAQFLKMGREKPDSQNVKIWLDTSDSNSQPGE